MQCYSFVAIGLATTILGLGAVGVSRADSLSAVVFTRADTDHTLVVSPRAHVDRHLDQATQLDVAYAADIWTSASIDVRTAATPAVTEQRDELDMAVTRSWQDVSTTASYRYSVENDYVSHGLNASGSVDLAQNSTTVAAAFYSFLDTVGRSGQPSFARALVTLGARASLTQLLDTETLLQLNYELGYLQGYQSSPYRYVGIGGTGLGCEAANVCLPEHMPATRTRHAFALLVRRALTEDIAIGASYRFYVDDWQLRSHTLSADLSWMPGAHTRFVLGYRFYIQSGVFFYLPVYPSYLGSYGFTTRDREQSPMHDQRVGVEWIQTVAFDGAATQLRVHTSIGALAFAYENFRGLRNVDALELTLALSLEF